MKSLINVALILLFYPMTLCADMEGYLKRYFQDLENRKVAVFFSKCSAESNSDYDAMIIFEVGSPSGLLIETKKDFVVNLSNVNITTKGFEIGDTHGGNYTRHRVISLINELMKNQFAFILPFRFEEFKKIISNNHCKNIQEDF